MRAHFRFTVAFCIGSNHQPLQSGYELYSATTGSSTAKRPFGGPEPALRYLGAYTHRGAISNHRLAALENGNLTFRWRDSAHGNKRKLMTLPVHEFLRRFLLHLLTRGFVRIRNFGFLANRRRASLLPICFELLRRSTEKAASAVPPSADHPGSCWRCPFSTTAVRCAA